MSETKKKKSRRKGIHWLKKSYTFMDGDHLVQCYNVDDICPHSGHLIHVGHFAAEEEVRLDYHFHQYLWKSSLESYLAHCVRCYVDDCDVDHSCL